MPLTIDLVRGPTPKPLKPMSVVGTAYHWATEQPPKSPPEAHNNGMGASGSTEEHKSEDHTDHCGDVSTQDELRQNAADSDLESASGDCLTCSDTEEVAIRTTQKGSRKGAGLL